MKIKLIIVKRANKEKENLLDHLLKRGVMPKWEKVIKDLKIIACAEIYSVMYEFERK